MCGIWCLAKQKGDHSITEEKAMQIINETLSNRGPEGGRVVTLLEQVLLGFTRLAINGLTNEGMQPFEHNGIWSVCNGEIYNYREIAARHGYDLKTGSDCEVLPYLYETHKTRPDLIWKELDGVFAAIIIDTNRGTLMVARDPYGVRPLFIGTLASTSRHIFHEQIAFGSELKSLKDLTLDHVYQYPPGHYSVYDLATLSVMNFDQYHDYPGDEWQHCNDCRTAKPLINDVEEAKRRIRLALKMAVKKRMLAERPVAALLSGGVDSSLIAALVSRELMDAKQPPLKTFSIGFEGSEDLKYARLVADHIGSDHHEIIMTPDDFFEAIPEVIKDIESFDTTSVRASVGNWLIAREIRRRTDCKVVFNGDGSDEVFGSYMYFYNAPSDEEFERESYRLLKEICYFDVLRSDRSISSHGLEPRTPFLDKTFVAAAKSVATSLRRPMKGFQSEKWILREAFNGLDLLPKAVLWRKKEAFSDGVSGPQKLWYQEIQERLLTSRIFSVFSGGSGDPMKADPEWNYHMMPETEEDIYYRYLFEKYYKGKAEVIPYKWMPRWCEGATDPSARTLKTYDES